MKTFLTILLLGSALFGCDDSIPLQRREAVDLGVKAKEPDTFVFFSDNATFTFNYPNVIPFEVPAHYECSKSGYGVVWEKTDNGYNVSCRKVQ